MVGRNGAMSSHIESGIDHIVGQLDLCSLYPYYSFLFFCRRPKMKRTLVKQARTKCMG